ncbi:MAG TPA: 7,8-didemethyl-8-hydroxy-5-deazariboflavin synthase CofG [Methylomirabilota bacterium]|nr:7,8-didemethyl-8-hydroxy-5-deazariboflavin synthase CofG [Methylomirabilota bacterium]
MSGRRALSPALETALDRVTAGRPLDRAAGVALVEATPGELPVVLEAAAAVRDAGKGRTVTYSRKVFLPLTNLCRDDCGYCTFKRDPGQPGAHTMSLDEVLAVCQAGARLSCKEALLSLGDKPEARFPEHRAWLRRRGYRTTLEYLRAACEAIVRHTSLLPHANPGLMRERDILALRDCNASLGLMLETSADRLGAPGGPHDHAPDKPPRLRLRTLEAAGRVGVAFTTGILIGIGETRAERVEALLAIREVHERYGHVQEVIVQNFRAKPGIPMARHPEPDLDELRRTLAVARLLLGPAMNVQAPPNLSPGTYPSLIAAGLNDWGGISPLTIDYINPEAPWPHLGTLAAATAAAGHRLRERLAIYPEFIDRPGFVPETLRSRVAAGVDDRGLVPEWPPAMAHAGGMA